MWNNKMKKLIEALKWEFKLLETLVTEVPKGTSVAADRKMSWDPNKFFEETEIERAANDADLRDRFRRKAEFKKLSTNPFRPKGVLIVCIALNEIVFGYLYIFKQQLRSCTFFWAG